MDDLKEATATQEADETSAPMSTEAMDVFKVNLAQGQTIDQESSDPAEVKADEKTDATTETLEKKEDSQGKKLSAQDKIDKRIAEIRAKEGKAERERDEALAKLEVMDKRIQELEKPKQTDKSYTDTDLMAAIKEAGEEGKWDVVAKATAEIAKNAVKADRETQEAKNKAQEAKNKANEFSQARDRQVIAEIIKDYPESIDPKSELRKTAEKVFGANPDLQKKGNLGMYQAFSAAYRILAEEGMIGPVRKQTKKSMKQELGDGSFTASESVSRGEDALDSYINRQEKIRQGAQNPFKKG